MPNPKTTEPDVSALLNVMSSPSGYAALRLGRAEFLYPWQINILDALEPRNVRVAARTCNESGKTSEIFTDAILWHMECCPGSLTVTTSGAYRQIVDQLFPNLRAYMQGAKGNLNPDHWICRKDSAVYLPTGSRLISFSTDDAGRAEGWHEPPRQTEYDSNVNPLVGYGVEDNEWESIQSCTSTGKTSLFIGVDEAKTPVTGIFDAFERCHPTRYFMASSPGPPLGPFHDAFHRAKDRYIRFHVDVRACPHLWDDPVKRREIEEQIATLPKPLVDSMIWGNFPDQEEYQVFNLADVNRAMSGTVPRWGRGTRRAALDLSGGGDETVLYMRDGNMAVLLGSWRERDDHKVVTMVIKLLQQHQIKPEWVFADNGGLGQTILNEFERRGWPLNRIDFNGKPRRESLYQNRRAEMHFELANKLKRNEIILPQCDILREQLGWQAYRPGTNRLQLVKKHTLPSSPDRSDTIVMLFDDMPEATEYRERQVQLDIAHSKTMQRPDSEFFEPGEDEFLHAGNW